MSVREPFPLDVVVRGYGYNCVVRVTAHAVPRIDEWVHVYAKANSVGGKVTEVSHRFDEADPAVPRVWFQVPD